MNGTRPSGDTARRPIRLLLWALFFSGAAAIVNQTLWQRALKIYLGGSEAISAMIVILVFMAGLGLGSLWGARLCRKGCRPLRALAGVELLLALVNAAVMHLLSLGPSNTLYEFQRGAVALGIPLRVLYALTSLVTLLGPCVLMGLSLPLAAHGLQSHLGDGRRRSLLLVFWTNTIGALLGALAAGYFLLPYYGQRLSLLGAALGNALAGTLVLWLARGERRGLPATAPGPGESSRRLSQEELAGFALGALALSYEMYLLRYVALAHTPRPYCFAAVLCAYLAFWTLGLRLAQVLRENIGRQLLTAALLLALVPAFHRIDRWWLAGHDALLPLLIAVYALPCISFGILYGQLVTRQRRSWGEAVGRYNGLNTLGSCLGVLATTLGGYRLSPDLGVWLLALGYLALYARLEKRARVAAAATLIVAALALARGLAPHRELVAYYGTDGVIEIDEKGNLSWDGLWHSALSRNGNHVGTHNWLLAVVPLLAHGPGRISDAAVVGLGTGITASTLARAANVGTVDVYEINQMLERVLRDYPEGTLDAARNPRLNVHWQDGRSGLALSPRKYDLISQQPMYLSQAGSSILLSEEYFRLVRARLKPRGVFVIYSHSFGNPGQARLVRQTVARVFPFHESFGDGYLLLASNEPITGFSREQLERTTAAFGPLADEVRRYGLEQLSRYRDVTGADWWRSPLWVTDDHPISEYPDIALELPKR